MGEKVKQKRVRKTGKDTYTKMLLIVFAMMCLYKRLERIKKKAHSARQDKKEHTQYLVPTRNGFCFYLLQMRKMRERGYSAFVFF